MAHINLLPWREALRQKKKQEYLATLIAVALSALAVCWLIASFIDMQVDNQQARNRFLETQITALDSEIAKIKDIKERKSEVEQRMALIEQLQANRNVAPNVLDELARIVPPGISFRTLQRKGNRMMVEGISESNNRLADFMRRLKQSDVFTDGDLSSIVADTGKSDAISEFKLTFNISNRVAPPVVATVKGAK